MTSAAIWTTGEAAEAVGIRRHHVSYWSRLFSITPARGPDGVRLYTAADLDLLRGVRALIFARELLMTEARRLAEDQGDEHLRAIGRDSREMFR